MPPLRQDHLDVELHADARSLRALLENAINRSNGNVQVMSGDPGRGRTERRDRIDAPRHFAVPWNKGQEADAAALRGDKINPLDHGRSDHGAGPEHVDGLRALAIPRQQRIQLVARMAE